MADAPKYSVVIPTTRPHLLRYSLASVLAQTMRDFEVIISYNVPPGVPDIDWLPDDPRIRYLRPERQLTQYENWDFVCQAARGTWMGLLGDDDALVPQALEIALEAAASNPDIKLISWKWGGFVSEDWPEPHTRGLATVPRFTGKTTRVSCHDFLTRLYGMRAADQSHMKTFLPSIMRGAYHIDIRNALVERIGHICMPWTPDYAAASLAMTYCGEMLSIDLPLVILGTTTDSMAAIYSGRPEVYQANFVASGSPEYRFTRVQAKVHSRPLIAETIMMMRERVPERLGAMQFELTNFLEWHYAGLLERDSVANVDAALAEFDKVVGDLSDAERATLLPRLEQLQKKRAQYAPPPPKPGRLRWLKQFFLTRPATRGLFSSTVARGGVEIAWPGTPVRDIVQFAALTGDLIDRNHGLRTQ